MAELLDIYCRRICAILRRKINGNVYVNPDIGNSEIDVEISWYGFQYYCCISKLHIIIHRGISSEDIANWIVNNYKNSLLKEAFL